MTRRLLFIVLALVTSVVLTAGPAASQAAEVYLDVDLRVIGNHAGGVVVVDRGSRDHVAEGDLVVLHPRGGGAYKGAVRKTADRSAQVTLADADHVPPVGTRGVVSVPASRFADAVDDVVEAVKEEPVRTPAPPPEPIVWENTDEDWSADMPLLSKVEVLSPEQRPLRISGRLYVIADSTWASEDDRSDVFTRTGADVVVENVFGYGGEFHYDGELNYRNTQVDNQVDRDYSRHRIDRLSYSVGGTRFAPNRHEAGRFLQSGMPEFGILDGYEWGHRFEDGNRVGASVGYVPEPYGDLSTGEDLQVAGYYRWVSDESERFSASAGVQKTWHNGEPDRDLFVAKMHYLPDEGWRLNGTAWVDYYTSSDVTKDTGLELTQAYLSASKQLENGGVLVTFNHIRFPELLVDEFTPVTLAQLADNRTDRLATRRWIVIGDDVRVFGELGAWKDQDENGGDLEVGLDFLDLFRDGSRTSASLFATRGVFTRGTGARFSHGWDTSHGRWDLAYEVAQHDNVGFTDDDYDIIQHWLGATYGIHLESGWDVSVSAGGRVWEDENSATVGVYAQKDF